MGKRLYFCEKAYMAKEVLVLTEVEKALLLRYESLTLKDKERIVEMRKKFGMTVDEIARRYQITPPDVNRILAPPPSYGNWTAEEKMRHWVAGQRRAATVKRQREAKI
jgi:predicted transcriptional regulator